jgi:hypothetical protein
MNNIDIWQVIALQIHKHIHRLIYLTPIPICLWQRYAYSDGFRTCECSDDPPSLTKITSTSDHFSTSSACTSIPYIHVHRYFSILSSNALSKSWIHHWPISNSLFSSFVSHSIFHDFFSYWPNSLISFAYPCYVSKHDLDHDTSRSQKVVITVNNTTRSVSSHVYIQ